MKRFAFLVALVAGAALAADSEQGGAGVQLDAFVMECGQTHCQITVHQAMGIRQFQFVAIATIRAQQAEIERLRRQCGERPS